MHQVFGIRHHGPGSARHLRMALAQMDPDMVLVEGPGEADKLLPLLQEADMKPPVALLVYRPQALDAFGYYPFAEFSPEWQAFRFALGRRLPVRCIDLSLRHYWPDAARKQVDKTAPPREDPMSTLARLAGFPDGEQWWDQLIEQGQDEEDRFAAVCELMAEVREAQAEELPPDPHTLRREAYMRQAIRAAEKEGFSRIAVVCGAYHAPALQALPPAKEDKARLKGLKKVKTTATWIPWTYARLAFESGYGAGVLSPAWYELLFQTPPAEVPGRWLGQAARLLREAGFDAAPAHAIEAVRLAHGLAHLRGQQQPRLEDLYDAMAAVYSHGSEVPLQLVHQELILGSKRGQVPARSPEFPLQADVRQQQRSLRLKPKEGGEQVVTLDLREDFHRQKSAFLHRLRLLEIDWGQESRPGQSLGTFKEVWQLRWEPECDMQVIAAASWGNTVEQAAEARVKALLREEQQPAALSSLLERVLLSNLPGLTGPIGRRLSERIALDADTEHLMEALPPLVKMLRYGDVRGTDRETVQGIVEALLPRLFLGLPGACTQVDEPYGNRLFGQLLTVNLAVQLLPEDLGASVAWTEVLDRLARLPLVYPRIAGGAARLSLDREAWSVETASIQLGRRSSVGTPVAETAAWLEGFLHGSGLLLIHQPALWSLLDGWVGQLSEGDFELALPLLRRVFSQFSEGERLEIARLVRVGKREQAVPGWDEARGRVVWPLLAQLIGKPAED